MTSAKSSTLFTPKFKQKIAARFWQLLTTFLILSVRLGRSEFCQQKGTATAAQSGTRKVFLLLTCSLDALAEAIISVTTCPKPLIYSVR